MLFAGERRDAGARSAFVAGRHEVTAHLGGSHARLPDAVFTVELAPLALHGCAVECALSGALGLLHATVRLRDAFGNTAAGVSGVHAFVVPAFAGGAVAAGMRLAASINLSQGTEALMRRTLRRPPLRNHPTAQPPVAKARTSSAGRVSSRRHSFPRSRKQSRSGVARSGTPCLAPRPSTLQQHHRTAAQSHRRTGAATSRALLTLVLQAVPGGGGINRPICAPPPVARAEAPAQHAYPAPDDARLR